MSPEEIQEPGLKAGSSIQILVESLFGNTLALVIDSEDTTDKLERDIRENSSCLLSVVRLLHGTKILKPGVSMAKQNVGNGDTIRLVLDLKGGTSFDPLPSASPMI